MAVPQLQYPIFLHSLVKACPTPALFFLSKEYLSLRFKYLSLHKSIMRPSNPTPLRLTGAPLKVPSPPHTLCTNRSLTHARYKPSGPKSAPEYLLSPALAQLPRVTHRPERCLPPQQRQLSPITSCSS